MLSDITGPSGWRTLLRNKWGTLSRNTGVLSSEYLPMDRSFSKKHRIISYVQDSQVTMFSRGGLDYTAKYPPVKNALASLNHDCIIDGEVVVFDKDGKADFDALQLYNGHSSPIKYCVFDLLYLDGHDLKGMPLVQRKQLLNALNSVKITKMVKNLHQSSHTSYLNLS